MFINIPAVVSTSEHLEHHFPFQEDPKRTDLVGNTYLDFHQQKLFWAPRQTSEQTVGRTWCRHWCLPRLRQPLARICLVGEMWWRIPVVWTEVGVEQTAQWQPGSQPSPRETVPWIGIWGQPLSPGAASCPSMKISTEKSRNTICLKIGKTCHDTGLLWAREWAVRIPSQLSCRQDWLG